MRKINIKPLSVNECWQGKRFKTKEYKQYEKDLLLMLPKIGICKAPFKITIEFAFSSTLADIDNPLKPFLDILQKKCLLIKFIASKYSDLLIWFSL